MRGGYKTLFLIFAFIFSVQSLAYGGWVNDWVQQKVATSPGYFQGQKRGYFTFGSFSARWKSPGTFYPFTFSVPSLKVGCGGIDIFGGGFGFVNPQYLVQQLQTMLQAAPAVAFDIALKTLCEQCSQTIGKIESMIQQLNGLQFNACKATRAGIVALVSKLSPEWADKNRAAVDEAHQTLHGFADMFTDIFESQQGISPTNPHTSQPASAQSSAQDMTKNCPQDIKDLFATNGTTVLEQVAKKSGFSSEYTNLIRGLVGDIQINVVNNHAGKPQLRIVQIQPCPQNKSITLDDFYMGNVYAEPPSGPQGCYNAHTLNLLTYVSNNLQSIYDKIVNGGAFTSQEVSIINTSPVPVYQALRMAVATGQEQSVIGTLTDVVAKAYAYGSMSDLYNAALHLIYTAREAIEKEGNHSPDCNLSITAADMTALTNFVNAIYKKQQLIMQDFMSVVGQINSLAAMVNNYRQAENIVKASLSSAVNSQAVKF